MARAHGGINFSMSGVSELRQKLKALALEGRQDEAARVIEGEMTIELSAAQSITPTLTGRLQRSGRVHPATVSLSGGVVDFTVRATFGGPDVPYAIAQHEILQYQHDDGEAKFLESTLRASRTFMGVRIAKRLQALFRNTP